MSATTPYNGSPAATQSAATSDYGWETQGMLTNFVVQSVNYDRQSNSYKSTVKLKGPYKTAVSVCGTLSADMALSTVLATPYFVLDTNPGNPMLPTNSGSMQWKLHDWQIDQDTYNTGIHAQVDLTFGYEDTSGSGGGGGQVIPGSILWNLNWQAASWDVYNYCANDELSSKQPDEPGAGAADTAGTAASIHIQDWYTQTPDVRKLQQKYNYKSTLLGDVATLNNAERLIAKKKMRQVQPTFHFPVLRRSETRTLDTPIQWENVGRYVDEIDIPSASFEDCPFTFTFS